MLKDCSGESGEKRKDISVAAFESLFKSKEKEKYKRHAYKDNYFGTLDFSYVCTKLTDVNYSPSSYTPALVEIKFDKNICIMMLDAQLLYARKRGSEANF